MKIDLEKLKKVHFIGIGGIGVSAIARMMMLEDKEVSGSDRDKSEITEELQKHGAKIFIGQSRDNIALGIDLVIYTVAIPDDNPELARARELGITCLTYPQALGAITQGKFTIAVAGAHGKTTTTAMIAKVFIDAGLDPTVVVGSLMSSPPTPLHDKDRGDSSDSERRGEVKWVNFIAGKSKYFIIEACEYRRSFLNYNPKLLVITNIDDDHLDYYKDMDDIVSAFHELALKVPESGSIICNPEQNYIPKATEGAAAATVDYSLFGNQNLKLKIPGEHNMNNAAAALAVADLVGIPRKQAEKSLESFVGTWRRSEFKGTLKNGAVIFDDYGHHPTEVEATLRGFREMFPNKRITVIFQPHLYSRTKQHLKHFGKSFSNADQVIIAPIYAAREPHDPSITPEMIVDEIRINKTDAIALPSFEQIEAYVKGNAKSANDVIITMGAGDIYHVGENILKTSRQ